MKRCRKISKNYWKLSYKMDDAVLHLTADKKEIKDFPKLPSATSFIRKPLSEMSSPAYSRRLYL